MINVRFKFTKGNEVKYISHLDLVRTFQRAIRRSGIPIAYSMGFNPHQEISFGAPLSLGVTSNAEYADMWLDGEFEICEMLNKLNNSLPVGIRILGGAILTETAKNAMSIVTHGRYTIKAVIENTKDTELQEIIDRFLAQESIKVMKKQPKKDFELKETDIKPLIMSIKVIGGGEDQYYLNCMLKSGSKANLKPELLMEALAAYSGLSISQIRINREETYGEKDGKLLDLLEYDGGKVCRLG